MEFKNPYALFKGEVVKASDVEVKDGFTCMQCNGDLILKRGQIRKHHFAHKGENCSINPESALHHIGKEIVCSKKDFVIKDIQHGRFRLVTGYKAEKEIQLGDIRVDVLWTFPNDKMLAIEIVVTNKCSEEKIDYFRCLNYSKNYNLSALEIDLSMFAKTDFELDEVIMEIKKSMRNPFWLYSTKAPFQKGKKWKEMYE